jgi:hypothetical protein
MRLFKDGLSRSATFWLGLLTLCFLAWLWMDSVFYETRIGLGGQSQSLTMVAGIVEAEWITGYPLAPKTGIGWGRNKRRKPVNIIWSPHFYGWSDGTVHVGGTTATVGIPIRTYHLQLALWIPFVVFTFIWCIALRFSLMRRKRIQQVLDCIR